MSIIRREITPFTSYQFDSFSAAISTPDKQLAFTSFVYDFLGNLSRLREIIILNYLLQYPSLNETIFEIF